MKRREWWLIKEALAEILIECSIIKDACCIRVKKIDAWNIFLKTVITEIDMCHFLMVRQIWCFHFNVDASTVIHFLPLSNQTTEKSSVCDCPQNDRKFAGITKRNCKFVKDYFFFQTYYKYVVCTALAINWSPDVTSMVVLTWKKLRITDWLIPQFTGSSWVSVL